MAAPRRRAAMIGLVGKVVVRSILMDLKRERILLGRDGTTSGSRDRIMTLPLALPKTLRRLISSGRWAHPGDEQLGRVIPELRDPVDFLSEAQICPLAWRTEHWPSADLRLFKLEADSPELPWLDPNKALVLAFNRFPGDDVALVLDFRASAEQPRVVVSHWEDGSGCSWVEVSESFDALAALLGLADA